MGIRALITFSRLAPSSNISRVRLDGAALQVRVRSDVDTSFYIVEHLDGREITRIDMADEHPRLKLETAIRDYLKLVG